MIRIRYFLFGGLLTLMMTIVIELLFIDKLDFYNKTRKVYSGENNVILLGSSRTYFSFIPDSISKENTFNYGLPGTANKLWINQLYDLSKDEYSQTIIINVDEVKLLDISDELHDGDFRAYLKIPRESFVFTQLSQDTKSKLKPFPLYYFGELGEVISKVITEYMGDLSLYNKGARIELNSLTENQFKNEKPFTPITETIISKRTDKILKAIEKLTHTYRKDRIIFVSIPVYGKADSNQTLKKIKLKYPDLGEFYDLSGLYSSREFFYNKSHPSLTGAVFLSDTIKKILTRPKTSILYD